MRTLRLVNLKAISCLSKTTVYVEGKGGIKLRKSGATRNRKVLRDNIQGITKPTLSHSARSGCVKRNSRVLKVILLNVIRGTSFFYVGFVLKLQ